MSAATLPLTPSGLTMRGAPWGAPGKVQLIKPTPEQFWAMGLDERLGSHIQLPECDCAQHRHPRQLFHLGEFRMEEGGRIGVKDSTCAACFLQLAGIRSHVSYRDRLVPNYQVRFVQPEVFRKMLWCFNDWLDSDRVRSSLLAPWMDAILGVQGSTRKISLLITDQIVTVIAAKALRKSGATNLADVLTRLGPIQSQEDADAARSLISASSAEVLNHYMQGLLLNVDALDDWGAAMVLTKSLDILGTRAFRPVFEQMMAEVVHRFGCPVLGGTHPAVRRLQLADK